MKNKWQIVVKENGFFQRHVLYLDLGLEAPQVAPKDPAEQVSAVKFG